MKQKSRAQLELENAFLVHTKEEKINNDSAYAKKQAEIVLYRIAWIVVCAVVVALMKLVIIQ